jgi:Xaa-Pro aminopeptidase
MPSPRPTSRACLWTVPLLTCVLLSEPLAGADLPGAAVAPPDSGLVPAKVLEQRRAALLDLLEPSIVLIRSADPRDFYEHPQDSDFRQDNDFYYLTGLETPGSWLVMFKPETGPGKVVLYLPERDPASEAWTGVRLGPGEEAARRTGIKEVRPVTQFEAEVVGQLSSTWAFREYRWLYLSMGEETASQDQLVELALEAKYTISDVGAPLAELRVVKDSVELARLRRAISITAAAQREAMKAARPGMYEYELEAVVEYVFRSLGAERVGYPSIVGSGPNSVVLHYDKNRRRMEEGDLVVIDVGAEYGYYTADVTRTLPVSGEFTERQRAIYELVRGAQKATIDAVRPGIRVGELAMIANRYMREHSDGLCGDVTCDRYFIHGIGHWLGMDVHDVGDYGRPLEPGMVLTVEPGIYLAEESLGVRIEDDVLVTEDGHEVLSAGAPKTVEEIEALMREEPCPVGCR